MGGKRNQQRKYFFFSTAFILIVFLLEACVLSNRHAYENIKPMLIKSASLMLEDDFKASLETNYEIINSYPEIKDRALFQIGLLYAHKNNPDKNFKQSQKYFKILLKDFPESQLINEAQIWIFTLQQIIDNNNELKQQETKIAEMVKERSVLKNENKEKDNKIAELENQIFKLKEIDLSIEEKKRKYLPWGKNE